MVDLLQIHPQINQNSKEKYLFYLRSSYHLAWPKNQMFANTDVNLLYWFI